MVTTLQYETDPKTRNRKLDRRRGLNWEDELTSKINETHQLGDAYNLGGSTTHIPDILFFSNYEFNPELHRQVKIDDTGNIDKFYQKHSITAIECKFTTFDELKIPKDDVDKCFEFLQRLGKYDRFVVIAVKFVTSKMKSKKLFLVMKYDYEFIRADYTYLHIKLNGNYYFMRSNGQGRQADTHGQLNSRYWNESKIRMVRSEVLKIDEI